LPATVGLRGETSGQAAIDELGIDLAKVANAHGKSTSELARALRDDKSLHVDKRGGLFYREQALPPSAADPANLPAAAPWTAPSYPLSQTFALHSNPGAKRVIYLDFDGHTLTGTAWNTGTVPTTLGCPAWDTDGNPAIFGDVERTKIQSVWRRMAEDYAPFAVDVTTEAPPESAILRDSAADEYYGMRVLISPISSYFGNYGGIAYVGVFDNTGTYYKPALVFPEKLGNSDRYIAEAAAHECGHTLGLLHDGTTTGTEYYAGHGTGATGWAPIMGNGYYKSLTQWSRGEYASANNTEDDLAIIGSGGAPNRVDDYPATAATAPRLGNGASLNAAGLIGPTGDVDVFSFAAGTGQVSLTLSPAAAAPNLDARIELRSDTGTIVASSNPTDTVGASLSVAVSAGTYFVHVTGVGNGDVLGAGYSNYGCLGAWNVSGTVPDPGTTSSPVAVLAPSATSGTAPAVFTFDGSASYDPDGTALTYAWDFGDGTTGSGPVATHTYPQAGSYAVVMTVTDGSGAAARANTLVSVVAPNTAPVASFGATGSGGVAPVTASFDGSSSYDPDGSIASWAWDFGDGTSSTGATASHLYAQAGSYTVKLTVTDDRGAKASSSLTFVVTAAALPALHIDDIGLSLIRVRSGQTARAVVRVLDAQGRPVAGATVTGVWSGPIAGTSTGTTSNDGTATLASKSFKKTGTLTLSVTKVAKTGWAYDSSANRISRVSIAAASPRVR